MTSKSLYIHIPFCESKCYYCDFFSIVVEYEKVKRYVDKLCKELELYRGVKLRTIYIGGGTPSLLRKEEIVKISKALEKNFYFDKGIEFTIEGNPNSIDLDKVKAWKNIGINRVSLGVQSFNNDKLKDLGRIHNRENIFKAIENLKKSGIENISIDLIFGLKGQNILDIKWEIEEFIKLKLNHISIYGLMVEENTPLFEMVARGKYPLNGEEFDSVARETIDSILIELDFVRYEISNYGRKGYFSAHNINYWENGEYIGVGAGATSKIDNKRYKRKCDVEEYILGDKFLNIEEEELTFKDSYEEEIILALRLKSGLKIQRFKEKYGFDPLEFYSDEIKYLDNNKCVKIEDDHLKLTNRGFEVANIVMAKFLKEERK